MGNCASIKSVDHLEEDSDGSDNILFMDQTLNSIGCSVQTCMYSQQGTKYVNQDAAVCYQGFGSEERSFFGVFDGHGKDGHEVSKLVRNRLPELILRQQTAFANEEFGETCNGEIVSNSEWRRACISGFKIMDKEIQMHNNLDIRWSGTTAVTIIVQGEDLVIANLGDSRAILGTMSRKDELIALQLTTDLKPDLPHEAERILQCSGRIFAVHGESHIQRVWLPNNDIPGLAMSRSLGDIGIKNHGIIAIPQMSHRRITNKDQFLVLATDGVWDVLTNDEVASIVWSVSSRGKAAKAVTDAAVLAWKQKYPSSKIDDCTVVCLFLQKNMHTPLLAKAACTSPT